MRTLTLFFSGIAQGKKLEENARIMAAYSNEELQILTVSDFPDMAKAGVTHLPAVAVDGRLVCEGRLPTVEELAEWVTG